MPATGDKLAHYGAVTLVNVFLGLATLIFLFGFLEWAGVAAVVTAVVASAVPCFLLNRRFVWRRAGRVRIRTEVVPFGLFTLLGLVLSSVLVLWAGQRYDSKVMVYVAHQSAFGLIWVLRYFFFDRVLWRGPAATVARLGVRRGVAATRLVEDLAA